MGVTDESRTHTVMTRWHLKNSFKVTDWAVQD
jgi:hypothetical protein